VNEKARFISATCVFTFLGILAGYPRFLVPVNAPDSVVDGTIKGFSVLFDTPHVLGVLVQLKMVALNLISSFNVPISAFLLAGVVFSVTKRARFNKSAVLLSALLVPYFIVNVVFYKFTATKLLILALPFLSIFAGLGLETFWNKMTSHKLTRASILIFVLAYSLIYAIRADMVFAKNDTRYVSTKWIESNIPEGSTIGIIQEPELLFSSRLIGKYRIYYYQEELNYNNNAYLKIKERVSRDKEEIFVPIICKYIVVSSWDFTKFETGGEDSLYKDFYGNDDFVLLKKIEYKEDLFLNPRPSYTCPVIFVFEKKLTGAKKQTLKAFNE